MSEAQPHLAPYAMPSSASRGRVHPEPPDPLRTAFEVDRHRILSCTAFRRVRSKTQVFGGAGHDHYRTRLTHTLEVAEIARLIAKSLRADETLAHTIALAHDLGHPPFGHAGETALAELMRGHGGFEHNVHSLRVVDYLEHPYPAYRGLNLSYEVREGLLKHVTRYDRPHETGAAVADDAHVDLLSSGPQPTVEAQIVASADRLAYDLHDLEDAMGAGLVDAARLARVGWWTRARADRADLPDEAGLHAIRRPVLDRMLDMAVADLIEASAPALSRLSSVDEVRRAAAPCLVFSAGVGALIDELEGLLFREVYRTEQVRRTDDEARRIVAQLFRAFLQRPEALPARFRSRIEEQGPYRVICDYIAGMTDRFCEAEWARLCTCSGS
ncbi:MAG: dNTP triphosphohydrolase [Phycisphaerales bacterium]|nr:dNTP triphosphohydrolase [Phycisphaerales bacterium]